MKFVHKCDQCDYETKYKGNLTRHKKGKYHKTNSADTHETKYKRKYYKTNSAADTLDAVATDASDLHHNSHTLKNTSVLPNHETKYKANLTRHKKRKYYKTSSANTLDAVASDATDSHHNSPILESISVVPMHLIKNNPPCNNLIKLKTQNKLYKEKLENLKKLVTEACNLAVVEIDATHT